MKRIIAGCLFALYSCSIMMADNKTINLRIIQTSDVHGCFFPYDFINRKPKSGSLARVITYVDSLRREHGKNVILLDNGDILQGQPTCYYCNYVKPELPNVAAMVTNYMQYDAQTIGNHDIETGHAVYDKWIGEVNCPTIGANIIDTKTNEPYVNPYTIIEREGVKIAVLGMITPAIPNWLNEQLWHGLRFDEMTESARYWIDHLQKTEKLDVIIGLFHAGKEGGIKTAEYEENASLRIAKEVAGFDLIFFGHDHATHASVVKNVAGQDVVCLNPGCNALMVADAEIKITVDEHLVNGRKQHILQSKTINGKVTDIQKQAINQEFMRHFQADIDSVSAFVNRRIGTFTHAIYTRDCYFGSAPFTDFIHQLQLNETGADISFNAPLSFDTQINAGDVHVSDLFNLYKYENQIYVVEMTGEEIRKYLEMSYALWVNTMTSPEDHIMLIDKHEQLGQQRYHFKNLAFNFDSAAGIDYEVDVTKNIGQRINILKMSNGTPFELNKRYKVAMNSYRGNGGGELLTKGAGITLDELKHRIVFESKHDQRYLLMKWIEKNEVMNPKANNNWRFVPEEWTGQALARDKKLIFGSSNIIEESRR